MRKDNFLISESRSLYCTQLYERSDLVTRDRGLSPAQQNFVSCFLLKA